MRHSSWPARSKGMGGATEQASSVLVPQCSAASSVLVPQCSAASKEGSAASKECSAASKECSADQWLSQDAQVAHEQRRADAVWGGTSSAGLERWIGRQCSASLAFEVWTIKDAKSSAEPAGRRTLARQGQARSSQDSTR
jgi:hypothetical protein